jgi:L-rhamnose mutarotase
MLKVFKKAGIHNFTIWNVGDELFSYYEVKNNVKCNKILTESEMIKKWDRYMEDLIRYDVNPETGRMYEMNLMFQYDAE